MKLADLFLYLLLRSKFTYLLSTSFTISQISPIGLCHVLVFCSKWSYFLTSTYFLTSYFLHKSGGKCKPDVKPLWQNEALHSKMGNFKEQIITVHLSKLIPFSSWFLLPVKVCWHSANRAELCSELDAINNSCVGRQLITEAFPKAWYCLFGRTTGWKFRYGIAIAPSVFANHNWIKAGFQLWIAAEWMGIVGGEDWKHQGLFHTTVWAKHCTLLVP